MKIKVGKKYVNGPITVTVLRIEPWSDSIFVDSDFPLFNRDSDGTIPMSLHNFKECYEEYKPTYVEYAFTDIGIVGLFLN
jgi:hypothetical protein